MANIQNKIKKKLWYKSISDYYKNYDVDYRGRFVYNANMVKGDFHDLEWLDWCKTDDVKN